MITTKLVKEITVYTLLIILRFSFYLDMLVLFYIFTVDSKATRHQIYFKFFRFNSQHQFHLLRITRRIF